MIANFAAASLAFMLFLPAAAQVNTATVYGSVTDTSGATVPGAAATLTNEGTGLSLTAPTDERGEFTLTFVPVGQYTVSITANGFKEHRQKGLDLAGGRTYRLSFPLELGQISEAITVTADAPLLRGATAEQRAEHSTLEVRELPLARRDWTNLIAIDTGTRTTGFGRVTMNGLPDEGFTLTVDGTNAQSNPETTQSELATGFGNVIRTVSLEAIAEVHVTKGIVPPEAGPTMSGNVNVITRSGTNELHGSLFHNYQSGGLNARSQFLTRKAPMVFNQFGGSLAGPAIRNRLFYFGVYEGYRINSQAIVSGNVPTAEFRARAVAAVPAFKQLFDLFPLPNEPYAANSPTGFHRSTGSSVQTDNHAVGRLDHYFNERNILTGRYTRGRPFRLNPHLMAVNARTFEGTAEVVTVNFTHTRPAWNLFTRFGFNKNDVVREDGIYALGIAGITGNLGFTTQAETLFLGGTDTSFEEIVARNIGRHTIKFGVLYGLKRVSRENIEVPELQYANEADLLANAPSRVRVTFGVNPFLITQWNTGFFFQDDIKLNSKLTLNVGVRHDYFSVPSERDGRLFNRDGPFGFGKYRDPGSALNGDFNNFSPRLGFAWSPGSRTVIRGGAGYFFTRHSVALFSQDMVQNALDEPSRVELLSKAEAQRFGLKYPVTNKDALPLFKGNPSVIFGAAFDPDFVTPHSIQYTLSAQREISSGVAIETAYVGNRGVKIPIMRQMNRPDRFTGQKMDAGFGTFRYYDSNSSSRYDSWQSSLRMRFRSGPVWNAHYTWARVFGYANNPKFSVAEDSPQDIFNLNAEYGPTSDDIRHRFVSDFVYEIPFARLIATSGRAARLALGGWQVGGILTAQTGDPLNVIQSSGYLGSRPDYIGGVPVQQDYRRTLVYLDRNTFARVPTVPATGLLARPGNLGRMAFSGPGWWRVDLGLTKNLAFTERVRLQLRADLLNGFNHTDYNNPSNNLTAANFGRITSTRGARTIQFNGRLTF